MIVGAMKLRLELTNPTLFPDAQHSRTIDGDKLVIGRSAQADWILPDADRVISKAHCRIERDGAGFSLIAMSVNGVAVNGAPLAHGAAQPLAHGDELTIGRAVIRVCFKDAVATTTAPASPSLLTPDLAFPAGPFGQAGSVAATGPMAVAESERKSAEAAAPSTLQDWWLPETPTATLAKSVDIPAVDGKSGSFFGSDTDNPLSTSGSGVARLRDGAARIDSRALVRAVEKAVLILPGEERERFLNRLCELLGGETAS